MPTFLSDPSLSLYLVLAVAFVIALAVWYRKRDRKSLLAALAFGLLVLGLYLIDASFESPREQANRRVLAMAEAATARDPARFVEQLSDSFNYRGATKEQMRTAGIWTTLRNFNARVAVWGFGKENTKKSARTRSRSASTRREKPRRDFGGTSCVLDSSAIRTASTA